MTKDDLDRLISFKQMVDDDSFTSQGQFLAFQNRCINILINKAIEEEESLNQLREKPCG